MNLKSIIKRAQVSFNARDFYYIYFRITQVIILVSLVLSFFALIPLMGVAPRIDEMPNYSSLVVGIFVTSTIWAAAELVAAEFAIRLIDRKNFAGVWIGVALAGILLPSLLFVWSLVGFFALLNRAFRAEYWIHAPAALRETIEDAQSKMGRWLKN